MQRFFFDTSFTRTQEGVVGITRTVRRLEEEIRRALPPQVEVVPVAFHSSGFRTVDADAPSAGTGAPAHASLAARAVRAISGTVLRRLVVRYVPLSVQVLAERVYNGILFDRLASGAPPAMFRPGDLLMMCDADWARPVWRAAAAARSDGAAVVVMMHDLIPLLQPEFAVPLGTRVFRQWLHAMLPLSDAIICNSRSTEEDLRAYAAAQALPLPPVGHFRLGADFSGRRTTGACRPHVAQFVRSPGACFAVVGTIEPRKNHAWLLAAFERLWEQGHAVRLLVIGRPNPECHDLLQRMGAHPEQGRRLLTVLDASDAEVDLAYAEARALVFPSLAEGFGLPLVEARSRGCPVIASDLPVFAELADAGVFLYARRSAEALQDLVLRHAAEDQRVRVGSMPPFTWSDSARQFLSVVAGLLQAKADASVPA